MKAGPSAPDPALLQGWLDVASSSQETGNWSNTGQIVDKITELKCLKQLDFLKKIYFDELRSQV